MTKPNEHEFFIELAVRATVEELPEAQRQQYETHLAECEECRAEINHLDNVFCSAALAMNATQEDVAHPRAPQEVFHLPLNGQSIPSVSTWDLPFNLPTDGAAHNSGFWSRFAFNGAGGFLRSAFATAAAIILVLIGGKFAYDARQQKSVNLRQAAEVSHLSSRIKDLEGQLSEVDREKKESVERLRAEVSVNRELTSKSRAALEGQLSASEMQAQTLAAQLSAERASGSELAIRLEHEQSQAAQLKSELEAVRSKNVQDTAVEDRKETRIAQLEIMLASERAKVDRDERLLAADRDIRDLMGARNLHIIDVIDVNGEGRSEKSFGRLFYTQGKSLTFYAFDLGVDKKRKNVNVMDATFQVWGVHGWERQSAHSLGIFYQDDKGANRWVLTFDDPNVLEEIDSVFVTIEPQGGSKRPTGRELLSAYLNSKVNHP